MKKIVFGSMTAALALAATPALSQSVNGVVNITANVPGKCQVVSPGPAGSSFTSTVDLGDISAADGTLLPSATLAALFNAGGSQTANLQFQVVCNTATPQVTVDSDPIVSATPAATGYANRVDYTGTVVFTTIPGSVTVNNASTAASATSTALNGRLVTGGSNVTVTASNFATANATDVLVAGAYAGVINITIAPAP
ncbi:hypothetical protein HFP51_09740 [Parasphingopyxis sp. CP4]|uniref:hypothetical protein n=1 Tax=Parasphingopyxis sp. CP4 TaxID=2724527 RepID=UPI0015A057A4|nr:hypothetical protein [Parasphingopyxis sp. CP4]QLC22436.1 hypothetical protein HFP51_09740 [Parasphingopyxis sp. CP4]